MIVDSIKNIDLYKNNIIHKNLYHYLEFMKNNDLNSYPLGRVHIDVDNFYTIAEIHSKEHNETFWESHKKYIDIHYILEGKEAIAYSPIENMKVKEAYNKQKDLIVYESSVINKIELLPTMFMVLTPNDAHMSNLYIEKSSVFKKFLFKVAI